MTRPVPDRSARIDALDRALRREASARRLDPPPPLDAERPERDHALRRHFGDGPPPLALVAFDTPGIQRYLFGVQRPVDIEGGSRIVEAFVEREPDDDLAELSVLRALTAGDEPLASEASFVYRGGGSGLLAVARADAERAVDTIEALFEEPTGGDLASVAVALPAWPRDLFDPALVDAGELAPLLEAPAESTRYAARLASLDALRRRRRSRRAGSSVHVSRGDARERCAACGVRVGTRLEPWEPQPRATPDPAPDREPPDALCESCRRRREVGARTKRGRQMPKSYEEMVSGLGGPHEGDDPRLAVLYADGANFGAAFRRVSDPVEHAALSHAVDRAVRAAVKQATGRAEDAFPELAEGWNRHQTPLRGGDDIVLILPVRGALEAMLGLVEGFETALDAGLRDAGLGGDLREGPGMGLGVGLVVAEWMFPIQFSLVWAKKLMDSAKRRLRGPNAARSAVDFMVLRSTAPLSEDLHALRQRHFEAREGDARLVRTRRPYAFEEFRDLVERARWLAQHVPDSQIHAMADAIHADRAVSRNLWRVQHARASHGQGWAAYRDALGLSLDAIGETLWRREPDEPTTWTTDYLDAFDLATLENTGDERKEKVA